MRVREENLTQRHRITERNLKNSKEQEIALLSSFPI
jgi:hypothetical protein